MYPYHNNSKCKNCLHYVSCDNKCVLYSPHMIVDTHEESTCEEWDPVNGYEY